MKEALSKIKYIFPAEKMQSNIAIFFSIFALFFAVGSSNVPCLNADTCSVGSDEVFSGTVTIQNNTNYGVKLTGNPTANRTITFPDADGTVKLAGATLTADKMLASDTNGEVAVTDKYPFTLGTAGQFLKVASTGLTMDFLTVGGLDSLTANAPYLSVNSSGAIDSSATLTASTPLKSNAQGQITASDLDPTTDFAVGSGTSGQQLRINSSANGWEVFTPSGGAGSFSAVASQNIVAGSVGLESNGQVRNIITLQNSSNELNLNFNQTGVLRGHSNYHNGYNIYVWNDSTDLTACDSGLKIAGTKFTNATTVTDFTETCFDASWSTACNTSGASCQNTNTRPTSSGNLALFNIDTSTGASNKYVLIYGGSDSQSSNCCIWAKVIDVNPSAGTFSIGGRTLLHDQNNCWQNSACGSYSTNQRIYASSIMGVWDGTNQKIRFGYGGRDNLIGYSPRFGTASLSGSTITLDSSYANEVVGNWTNGGYNFYNGHMLHDWSTGHTAICNKAENMGTPATFILDFTGNVGGNAVYGAYSYSPQWFWGTSRSIPASMTTENQSIGAWYSGSSGCSAENTNIHWDYDAERFIKVNMGYPSWGQSWNYDLVITSFNLNNNTSSAKNQDCDFSTDANCYDGYYTNLNNVAGITCQNQSGKYCSPNFYNNSMTYDDTNDKWYWTRIMWGVNTQLPTQNCYPSGTTTPCPIAIEFEIDANDKPVYGTMYKYTFPEIGLTSYPFVSYRASFIPLYSDTYSILGTTQSIDTITGTPQYVMKFGAVTIPDNISSYIGYVGQSANQGDTVNVISVGGLIDGQTGLTIGEKYYVQSDGSFGTVGEYFVGRAISSTEIYISNTR